MVPLDSEGMIAPLGPMASDPLIPAGNLIHRSLVLCYLNIAVYLCSSSELMYCGDICQLTTFVVSPVADD